MELDKLIRELSSLEKRVLLTLEKLDGKADPETIFKQGDFSQDVEVMNAASWLQSKNLVVVEEHVKTVYVLGSEGEEFLKVGLPERRALQKIVDLNGSARLQDLLDVLKKHEIPVAIGWLKQKGWATISKQGADTVLMITDLGRSVLGKEDDDEKILRFLSMHPNSVIDKQKYIHLVSRKNVVKEKEIIEGSIRLTDLGRQVLKQGIVIQEEISQITDKVIKDRLWEKKPIRPYDVSAFAPRIYGGKLHPFNVLIDDIRQIFLEMGFQEIAGNFVESCFWNMDVLFIPQDHPAREMQDTFYCKTPSQIPVEDKKLMDTIAEVHKNGGSTGSDGWGYDFSKDEGEKAEYQEKSTISKSEYNVAVADFMKAPDIDEIDITNYTGKVGDTIRVRAIDDFKVVQVQISIINADGTILEEGNAVLQDNGLDWIYTATQQNDNLDGDKIIVRASDKPGNITTEEEILTHGEG